MAIIVGYNGNDYCGSQKNPGVRTVEGDMEVVLHNMGYIQTYNFGDLQKIGWGRATRTDKRVHALQNCFSCKLHIHKNADFEEHRAKINEQLPKDQRIFAFFPVGMRFNAKNCTSHREYSYFLPTFMLQPI